MVRRGALVLLALVLPLPAAAADLPRDVQRSVTLYEQGRKLVEGGDCTKAIPLFEESIRYNESIGAHLSIAECRGDNPLAAWREYKVAEALAKRKEDDRARYAHDHASALQSRLAMIRIEAPPRARAFLDDHPLEQIDEAIAVEPGAHTLEILRADNTRWSKPITAVAGATVSVSIAPDPLREEHFVGPPEHDPGKPRRLTGVIVGGAGVGLAIAGGVFGFLAASKLNDAKSSCSTYPHCTAANAVEARDANDSGRTDALVSTIGIGVGVAAIALGAVLYFTAPKMVSHGGFTTTF